MAIQLNRKNPIIEVFRKAGYLRFCNAATKGMHERQRVDRMMNAIA